MPLPNVLERQQSFGRPTTTAASNYRDQVKQKILNSPRRATTPASMLDARRRIDLRLSNDYDGSRSVSRSQFNLTTPKYRDHDQNDDDDNDDDRDNEVPSPRPTSRMMRSSSSFGLNHQRPTTTTTAALANSRQKVYYSSYSTPASSQVAEVVPPQPKSSGRLSIRNDGEETASALASFRPKSGKRQHILLQQQQQQHSVKKTNEFSNSLTRSINHPLMAKTPPTHSRPVSTLALVEDTATTTTPKKKQLNALKSTSIVNFNKRDSHHAIISPPDSPANRQRKSSVTSDRDSLSSSDSEDRKRPPHHHHHHHHHTPRQSLTPVRRPGTPSLATVTASVPTPKPRQYVKNKDTYKLTEEQDFRRPRSNSRQQQLYDDDDNDDYLVDHNHHEHRAKTPRHKNHPKEPIIKSRSSTRGRRRSRDYLDNMSNEDEENYYDVPNYNNSKRGGTSRDRRDSFSKNDSGGYYHELNEGLASSLESLR